MHLKMRPLSDRNTILNAYNGEICARLILNTLKLAYKILLLGVYANIGF